MTHEEILVKALEKAAGADKVNLSEELSKVSKTATLASTVAILIKNQRYFSVIFEHSFAKAFWGEEVFFTSSNEDNPPLVWQYHLQQMVLSEDPIKYLEYFL